MLTIALGPGAAPALADDGPTERLIGTFRTRPAVAPPAPAQPDRPAFLTGALASTQSPEDTFRRDAGDRIFFTDGSAALSARAAAVLAVQAEWLKRRPTLKLTVEGHADDGSSAEDNIRISERRAEAVRDRLVAEGVDGRRIVLVARGREQRVAVCPGAPCAAQNRRAVVVVHAAGAGDRIGLDRAESARRGDAGGGRAAPGAR